MAATHLCQEGALLGAVTTPSKDKALCDLILSDLEL